jgi:methionyl-tRNA formyltransferase
MRAILLTSTFRRHHYMANALAAGCDLVGVWQEEKSFQPERYARNDVEARVINEHFAKRDESEERYFPGHAAVSAALNVRRVPPGACNDPAEIEQMSALQPAVVLVFGTGMLRDRVLTTFAGRIINIHLGLSPYYRGSGTNFWPLVNREPEYVGATIHCLDPRLDYGSILTHARPAIDRDDGPHDIGNKAILRASDVALQAAASLLAGNNGILPQWTKGRLYQRKHFSADAVRRLYRHFETGMIGEYLAHLASRDAVLRLIEPAKGLAR